MAWRKKGRDLIRLQLWVDPDVDQAIEIAVAHFQTSKHDVVEAALRDFLKRKLDECRSQNLWPAGEEVTAVRPADGAAANG